MIETKLYNLPANSFVVLRDLEGLPAPNLSPYFFLTLLGEVCFTSAVEDDSKFYTTKNFTLSFQMSPTA